MISVDYLIHKALLTVIFAVLSFIWFNIWKKSKPVEIAMLFLGKHSTNIWLCHMFFYVSVFPNFVTIVKYPIFILLLMIIVCVITSYLVLFIQKGINCWRIVK